MIMAALSVSPLVATPAALLLYVLLGVIAVAVAR
jgi:hypothetical protein